MNAPLIREARLDALNAAEMSIDAAVERANKWVDTARPIIKAWFQLDEAQVIITRARLADPKGFASYDKMSPAARDWECAQSVIDKARDDLFEMLDGIRDNFLCDERVSGPQCGEPESPVERQAWDNAWDDATEFNDQLDRECVSVDQAVRMVEREA